MSDIESDFFIRWRVIIEAFQKLYIKPLQRTYSLMCFGVKHYLFIFYFFYFNV